MQLNGKSSKQDSNGRREYDYQINLKIEDIRLLHHCVEETFKNWLAPEPVDEQEHLRYLNNPCIE